MRRFRLIAVVLVCGGYAAAASAETVTYTYDAKGRLVKVVKYNTPYNPVTTDITHDKADNRTRVVTVATPR